MKLSELKNYLKEIDTLNFKLANGSNIPAHFHITEIGKITKDFIDCGGTVRQEKVANFQIWLAQDIWHKLSPEKLLKIINLSEPLFNQEDLEVEIEYQLETIGKYSLKFQNNYFILEPKQTACLAEDACGIVSDVKNTITSCCDPNSKCC